MLIVDFDLLKMCIRDRHDIAAQLATPLQIKLANEAEISAHREYLAGLSKSGNCVWNNLEPKNAAE